MKINFLGTGTSQGVPVIACDCEVCRSTDFRDKRLRTSLIMEWDNKHLVIDTGPDFRYQMLRLDVQHLDAILFTHAHKDHIAGLDDVRAFNRKQGKPIDIFADLAVHDALKREFFYAFHPQAYFGVPQLNLLTIEANQSFEVLGKTILPIPVLHYKMPVLGFRIEDFTYITDAKTISEEAISKIKGSRILVLNALQQEQHISHMTLQEAIEMAKQIGAEKTYFTHISHNMGLHAEIQQILPKGMFLAYDGLELEV